MHAKEVALILSLVAFLSPDVGYSQEFGTGAIFLPPGEYNALQSAEITRDAPIPGSIDLVDHFPTPGNQGAQASCVGWAVAYTKAYLENVERLELGSTPVMYSPSFIFNQIKITDCFNGSYISDALELVKRQGSVNIHEFVYSEQDCNKKPAAETLTVASRTKALSWGRIKSSNELLDITKVQDFLISGVPVIIGADVQKNFQEFRGSGVYDVIGGGNVVSHAMVIIGFDSQRHAYRLINSWGTGWGDRGYAWVNYDTMQRMVHEAYVVFDESFENAPWSQYQRCLNAGQARCCDHLSDNFSRQAKLCTHIPGLDRMTNYRWCVSTGRKKCCDHLTPELIKTNRIQGCLGQSG